MNTKGRLYLIPTRLGENAPLEVLPISVKKVIESVDYYIVENEKTARRFIKAVSAKKSQQSLKIFLLNKFTNPLELPAFLDPCMSGKPVGLLSEAGCPGVADPGADIVRLAHEKDIKVVPLVGPSSILLSLMSSGMNGQNFAFNGYLAIDKDARKSQLKQLEKTSAVMNQTQIFIETPYRNNKMIEDLCKYLQNTTRVCIACDITLSTEFIKTKTVAEWKSTKLDLHKRPAIFLIKKD